MIDFDLSAMDTQDEGELVIRHPKTLESTGWSWTFYGPGHPVTIALSNRVAGAALKKSAARRQAQINGRKWKEDEESLDQLRTENVDNIVTRTKSFTPNGLSIRNSNGQLITENQLLQNAADLVRRAQTPQDQIAIAQMLGFTKEWVPLLEQGAGAIAGLPISPNAWFWNRSTGIRSGRPGEKCWMDLAAW
jgi:hypothetical protein